MLCVEITAELDLTVEKTTILVVVLWSIPLYIAAPDTEHQQAAICTRSKSTLHNLIISIDWATYKRSWWKYKTLTLQENYKNKNNRTFRAIGGSRFPILPIQSQHATKPNPLSNHCHLISTNNILWGCEVFLFCFWPAISPLMCLHTSACF